MPPALQCWRFVVSQPVITETDCTFLSQLKETERTSEKPELLSFSLKEIVLLSQSMILVRKQLCEQQ